MFVVYRKVLPLLDLKIGTGWWGTPSGLDLKSCSLFGFQSEYSRRICLNMLIMETRLQNRMLDPTSVPLATTANGGDWQEEVYQKIKTMKDLYLLDLRFMHIASGTVGDGAVGDAILESDDWRVQLRTDSRQRVVNKMYVLALC
ncbi:putative mediator of RNA polymerase II transcription subunit 15a/b/c [Helianthus annuus]|nr:putative mediator of RNA polymerase II transcription subunit 15a/b/c [Helianthus annuus]